MDVGQERLTPRCHELDGAAEGQSQRDGRHVVLVHVDLDPEGATDVGSDHANAVLGQVEEIREHRLHHVRHLRRDPHRERADRRVEVGDEATRLQRYTGVAADRECSAVGSMSPGEDGVDVAGAQRRLVDQVVTQLVVDQRRSRRERIRWAEHGRQRLVVNDHTLGGVLRLSSALGGDRHNGLADAAHTIGRQRQHRAGLHALVMLQDAAVRRAEP